MAFDLELKELADSVNEMNKLPAPPNCLRFYDYSDELYQKMMRLRVDPYSYSSFRLNFNDLKKIVNDKDIDEFEKVRQQRAQFFQTSQLEELVEATVRFPDNDKGVIRISFLNCGLGYRNED